MISPAAQHRNRIAEEHQRSVGKIKDVVERVVSAHESVVLSQFKSDLNKLAFIRSRSRRNNTKQHLLGGYSGWVDEFMQAGSSTQSQGSMFVWLLLWSIDVGHWQKSLDMFVYALEEGLQSPEGFNRNLHELVTEQVADGINKSGQQEQYQTLLDSLYSLVTGLDMKDQILAKLCKARGLSYLRSDENQAQELLQKAFDLNENSGVKRILKQLKKGISTVDEKDYPLNTSDAAALLGVSVPTIIRHTKNHPERLPSLHVMTGGRTVYRFRKTDVSRYKENYLVIKQ